MESADVRQKMMKKTRVIASVLALGPLVGLIGVVAGMTTSFAELAKAAEDIRTEALAVRISIALYSQAFALIAFPVGVFLHSFAAKRSGIYSRGAWILMLCMSILYIIQNPAGIILGGTTVVLLFTLQTFKNMRNGEQAESTVPSEAAPSASPDVR